MKRGCFIAGEQRAVKLALSHKNGSGNKNLKDCKHSFAISTKHSLSFI